MSRTISIKGFIRAKQAESYQHGQPMTVNGVAYQFTTHDSQVCEYTGTIVCPHTLTFELPEKYDPRTGFIQSLQAERKKAQAEFQHRITEIDRQISQLQAIELTTAGAS